MTDPNPALAALLASGRRELAKHRVTHLHKPKPTPPEDTAVSHADDPQPPMPAEGAPHAYVAVQRTHSVNADRPEWNDDATVIPAWDTERIEEHRRHAQHHDCTLLPIGPDGDTGTRAITEPAPPALELTRGAWLRNHLGAEIFVVEPARTALAPDLWTVDTCGVGVELATAEGLAACGYTLVTEEPRPEYPTCGTCGRVQVHGTVYAECECP